MNVDPIPLKSTHDYLAPDGSEIYLLADGSKGSLCQCILPVGATSHATSHKTVEELWFFLEGEGEVYREGLNNEEPISVFRGISLVIPVQTIFQFRNTGKVPLKFVIATMPPWPGKHEANTGVVGKWQQHDS